MTFNFREVEHSDIDDIRKLKHCRGKLGWEWEENIEK